MAFQRPPEWMTRWVFPGAAAVLFFAIAIPPRGGPLPFAWLLFAWFLSLPHLARVVARRWAEPTPMFGARRLLVTTASVAAAVFFGSILLLGAAVTTSRSAPPLAPFLWAAAAVGSALLWPNSGPRPAPSTLLMRLRRSTALVLVGSAVATLAFALVLSALGNQDLWDDGIAVLAILAGTWLAVRESLDDLRSTPSGARQLALTGLCLATQAWIVVWRLFPAPGGDI